MTEAIVTKNLGKKYIISHEKEAMVRHILPGFLKIKNYEAFWALQDINLKINKGECLGIIGRNGAGKSTLLNILAGVTFPTLGLVKINGKISAILSLGAGFHPELTGEENIYLNASILGLRLKEIKERFKEIIEFSGLNNFIDAPLKTYSAGMYMRLGFSIAAHIDFDILLIDEILSVGDISFQEKCLNKLKEFRRLGKTLIMVSQSPFLLQELTDRIILLEKGNLRLQGMPKEVNAYYEEMMAVKEAKYTQAVDTNSPVPIGNLPNAESEKKKEDPKSGWGTKRGTGDVRIKRVRFLNPRGKEEFIFETGSRLKVWVDFTVLNEVKDPHFGIAIFKDDGTYCYGPNTRFDGIKIPRLKKGEGWFSLEYRELNLLPGNYKVSVAIWEKDEKFAYDYHYAYYKFEVVSDKEGHGVLYLDHKWKWRSS